MKKGKTTYRDGGFIVFRRLKAAYHKMTRTLSTCRLRPAGCRLLVRDPRRRALSGYTLLELTAVIAILGVMAAIGAGYYIGYLEKTKMMKCYADMRYLMREIDLYREYNQTLPLTLDDLRKAPLRDAWGSPFVYLNFETIKGKGKGAMRKDRFLVPINDDYDLCSMGPDGKTATPLTAKASRDDIIRANNGQYLGRASKY